MMVSDLLRKKWLKIQAQGGPSPLTPLLAVLSHLYRVGVRLRLAISAISPKKSLPGFVISLGNITIGGTGKTPAVKMIAEWARGKGLHVAVLSRGYGGRHRGRVLEVSNTKEIIAGPEAAGDEPYLLAKNLRGIPVIVAKKRLFAGRFAHQRHQSNFFILDDGFQHLALKRDLDLLLIDAQRPFGNQQLLPWGSLREPLEQLARADAFIITRSGQTGHAEGTLSDFLQEKYPQKPLFRSAHVPDRIMVPRENGGYGPEFLNGKRIVAFAGIAQPETFRKNLIELGAEVIYYQNFSDHYPYTQAEMRELISQKEILRADYLVTTEKDWVRIEKFPGCHSHVIYLTIKFSLLSSEKIFYDMIEQRVEQAMGPLRPGKEDSEKSPSFQTESSPHPGTRKSHDG